MAKWCRTARNGRLRKQDVFYDGRRVPSTPGGPAQIPERDSERLRDTTKSVGGDDREDHAVGGGDADAGADREFRAGDRP